MARRELRVQLMTSSKDPRKNVYRKLGLRCLMSPSPHNANYSGVFSRSFVILYDYI